MFKSIWKQQELPFVMYADFDTKQVQNSNIIKWKWMKMGMRCLSMTMIHHLQKNQMMMCPSHEDESDNEDEIEISTEHTPVKVILSKIQHHTWDKWKYQEDIWFFFSFYNQSMCKSHRSIRPGNKFSLIHISGDDAARQFIEYSKFISNYIWEA